MYTERSLTQLGELYCLLSGDAQTPIPHFSGRGVSTLNSQSITPHGCGITYNKVPKPQEVLSIPFFLCEQIGWVGLPIYLFNDYLLGISRVPNGKLSQIEIFEIFGDGACVAPVNRSFVIVIHSGGSLNIILLEELENVTELLDKAITSVNGFDFTFT